jgi:hypothetical protein
LDWELESKIRRFLGAAQFVLGKLVKNGWLDGVRGKVENSVQFLPYASHQHWHAIGSSRCEHDPQKMAEFIKAEVDAILVPACLGVYADVVVAVIPSATDLRKWVKYANKPICLVEAVNSVYNRYPDLGHRPALKAKFLEELRLYPQRSKRVFGMIRCSIDDERGQHTYNLNRRYVAGNHRFKRGGVLTEPERHRLWRERHAERATAKRKAGLEAQEDRVLGLLDQRAQKPWPENTLKAQDVQRVCHCKETKARGILTRLKLAGKLIPKKRRCKPGQPSTEFYMKASRAKPKRARSPALPNPSHSALRCPLPEATQAHHLDLQVVMRAIRASRLLGNCLPILHQVQVDKERDCPSLMKMSRTAAISNTENGVYDGLRPRSPKKWPKNSVSARDLQRARIALTSTEATAILSQMEDEGKIIGQDQQAPSGGHRATSESHHADVMRALRNTIQ